MEQSMNKVIRGCNGIVFNKKHYLDITNILTHFNLSGKSNVFRDILNVEVPAGWHVVKGSKKFFGATDTKLRNIFTNAIPDIYENGEFHVWYDEIQQVRFVTISSNKMNVITNTWMFADIPSQSVIDSLYQGRSVSYLFSGAMQNEQQQTIDITDMFVRRINGIDVLTDTRNTRIGVLLDIVQHMFGQPPNKSDLFNVGEKGIFLNRQKDWTISNHSRGNHRLLAVYTGNPKKLFLVIDNRMLDIYYGNPT